MYTFTCLNNGSAGEGSCSIDVDSSYSEGVVCVRSESTSSEDSISYIYFSRDCSPTQFLKLHCVVGDRSITFNAFYIAPGYSNSSGGCGVSHIVWNSSGDYVNSVPVTDKIIIATMVVITRMVTMAPLEASEVRAGQNMDL